MQFGQKKVKTFYMNTDELVLTPIAEQEHLKGPITGLVFTFGRNLVTIDRSAYDFLDWLGDWGGLMDALLLIIQIVIGPC